MSLGAESPAWHVGHWPIFVRLSGSYRRSQRAVGGARVTAGHLPKGPAGHLVRGPRLAQVAPRRSSLGCCPSQGSDSSLVWHSVPACPQPGVLQPCRVSSAHFSCPPQPPVLRRRSVRLCLSFELKSRAHPLTNEFNSSIYYSLKYFAGSETSDAVEPGCQQGRGRTTGPSLN